MILERNVKTLTEFINFQWDTPTTLDEKGLCFRQSFYQWINWQVSPTKKSISKFLGYYFLTEEEFYELLNNELKSRK